MTTETKPACPDCTNGWIVQTGGRESVKPICATCNYVSLSQEDLESHLAAVVSVECPGDDVFGCKEGKTYEPSAAWIVCHECQGSGRRWLLREACGCIPDKEHPQFDPDHGRVRSWDYNNFPRPRTMCQDCNRTGWKYSGDYDGLRAAIEAKGWMLHIRSSTDLTPDGWGDWVNVNGSDVWNYEGITGLRAIQVAIARAWDAKEAG